MNEKPTPLDWLVWSGHKTPDPTLQRLFKGMPGEKVVGMTPNPTATNGWLVTAAVKPTRQGLIVHKVTVEPSPLVEDGGRLRSRRADEYDVNINSSVMNLVDLTRIRSEYRDFVNTVGELAKLWGHSDAERWKKLGKEASIQNRKRSVNNPENMYQFAQDVIEVAREGRGMRSLLARRWDVAYETVKSRMRLLRNEGWVDGGSTTALPGPTYLYHEETLGIDNPKERT